jgi:hypothetical protein
MPVPKFGAAFSCVVSSWTGPPMVSATASFCWFVQLGTCLAPSAEFGRELGRAGLELLCAVVEFGYAACQLGVTRRDLLGSVAQLGEFVGQVLPLAADLVEGRAERAARCAQP